MELGEKLKQARLEAGLSQRQLCGDTITRNMLSQIENGSAKPSYATLQVLSARLGKPVSYFWEDAPSENLALLHKAQQADAAEAMEILKGYLPDDPILDRWYYFLLSRCCMDLAEQALEENRIALAQSLLSQAEQAMIKTPDLQAFYAERLALLQYRAGTSDAVLLAARLPDNTQQMLLRAAAALVQGKPELCLACLDAADRQTEEGLMLRGDALVQSKAYADAANCYLQLVHTMANKVYAKLELCYRELGDFQKAYEYACKQR